jgi:hypothetical protein
MANDKDFVVNGPVAVGKDTKVTVGSIAAGAVDLSTGNYFTDSPSGDYTYTFANPGDVQAFQIEATGGSAAVAEVFGTYVEASGAGTTTVDQGINLADDGGLWWGKIRNLSGDPDGRFELHDTVRGAGNYLRSDSSAAVTTNSYNFLSSFTSTGYTGWSGVNGYDVVSWSFKKQTKFFDIVTYTGDGDFTGRTISHNLGSVPGMILIKKTSGAADWIVYHRSEGATKYLELNNTSASNTYNMFNDTDPTATEFSVSSYSKVNNNGDTYVAYLFAHDTASDGLIQCGSYTGNGGDLSIDLGFKPQFVIIKNSTNGYNWQMHDNVRGVATGGNDARLHPNLSNAEATDADWIDFNTTGFTVHGSTGGNVGANGHGYIYMAIRSASAPAITWPTNIEWPAGITPSTPAEGETDVFTFTTDDGGTTYTGIQSIDNAS